MHDRARIGIASAAVLLLAAACSGSSSTPTPAPVATAAPTPAPTVAAPGASVGIALPSGFPAGSFGIPNMHEAPDLEAQLPDNVNGTALQKLSFSGSGMAALGGSNTQEFDQVLSSLGKSPADFTAAVATDMGGGKLDVTAVRIAGVDSNALYQAFAADVKKTTPNCAVG